MEENKPLTPAILEQMRYFQQEKDTPAYTDTDKNLPGAPRAQTERRAL